MLHIDNAIINTNLLERHGLLDDVYEAVSALDTSAAVLAALDGMRKVGTIPVIPITVKNSDTSRMFRSQGNDHYTSQRYLKALEYYNTALKLAPLGSEDILLAYSNRSQLLLKLKAYTAAFKDAEMCLKLECKGELRTKVNKRRDECLQMMREEKLEREALLKGVPEGFFNFNQKKHPEIPCLSADVDVVSVSGERKIVAAQDIAAGSVIAVEKAFTTYCADDKSHLSCHYCQKMTFNLIPCDNCCFALFCDTTCKRNCLLEYHEIECQIMNFILLPLHMGHRFHLTIKTVLKLKSMCKQWSILNEESANIGAGRLNTSSLGQVYDETQYSSVLCFKENTNFVHGRLYNNAFAYATVLHYLENIPGFFPEAPTERLEARKCFAKLCMTIDAMCPYVTEIHDTVERISERKIYPILHICHFGLFSFTGKLKHSCDPNVVILGLNNRVALMAVQPIKKMSEITVSYVAHYYDRQYVEGQRATKIYRSTMNVCNCIVCKDSWGVNYYSRNMNPAQREGYLAWDFMRRTQMLQTQDGLSFHVVCNALQALIDLGTTKEHFAVYADFRRQLSLCQQAVTQNITV